MKRPPGHLRRLLKESLGSSATKMPQIVPHVPGFSAMIGVASLTLALATCFTLLHNLRRILFQNLHKMSLHSLAGSQAASGEKISVQDRIEGAEQAQNGSDISETM